MAWLNEIKPSAASCGSRPLIIAGRTYFFCHFGRGCILQKTLVFPCFSHDKCVSPLFSRLFCSLHSHCRSRFIPIRTIKHMLADLMVIDVGNPVESVLNAAQQVLVVTTRQHWNAWT
jgi:hypothetical protein